MSLWADPQPEESQQHSDVVARVVPEEPDPPPRRDREPRQPRERQPTRLRPATVAIGAFIAIVIVGLAASQAGGSFAVEDVPSAWDDTPMICKTVRLEEGPRAIELFRCRAVAGPALPPGVYRAPDSRWTSDITRVPARANGMEIARDGELIGWATY